MKVKVSELKTHLSRYLKEIEEKGTIEVCLREEPVAYLVAAGASGQGDPKELEHKVRTAGLILHSASRERLPMPRRGPEVAGDGREDISTVEAMRRERDY